MLFMVPVRSFENITRVFSWLSNPMVVVGQDLVDLFCALASELFEISVLRCLAPLGSSVDYQLNTLAANMAELASSRSMPSASRFCKSLENGAIGVISLSHADPLSKALTISCTTSFR